MFATIGRIFRIVATAIGYALAAMILYSVVTAIAFPFMYGVAEIMNSIARLAMAYVLFLVASLIELFVSPLRPTASWRDAARIDEDQNRLRGGDDAVRDAVVRDRIERDQLNWWIVHDRRG